MTGPSKSERRLAAILAADMAGYSRLMGVDETGTLARLQAFDAKVIEPAVADHGGRIIKRMGDGYLVEFASVVSAVDCAKAWQAGAVAPILFRIGIHLGDVIVADGDLFGEGVNIAARLETLAETGGICVSEDAWRQTRGKIDASFEDLGPKQLKNISEPVRVFRVVNPDAVSEPPATNDSEVSGWRPPGVLFSPLRPLGGHAMVEELSAGLTETLASALAQFEEFDLIDPGSARDKIGEIGAQAAGLQLGATYILEGSVQIAAGMARIGAQLIYVANGNRVWSETLDRSLDDVFELQDDVTAFVASTMGDAVAEEQANAIAHKATAELTDQELFVRGLQHLHRVSQEENRQARQIFNQIRNRTPDEMLPTLCYCWTYASELTSGWPPSRPDALEYCLDLMRGLLRRHDRSAHVHRLMSRLMLLSNEHDQALAHARRARQLNPYNSDMMVTYGAVLVICGEAAEGLIELERAQAVNPYVPAAFRSFQALSYFLVGRYQEGVDLLSSVDGDIFLTRVLRIALLSALNRNEEVAQERQALLKANPQFTITHQLSSVMLRCAEHRDMLASALRQAGLPE